jgi:lipopolysaccharide/colanic/teichoic acid biosynthesis glycosyltransferase
MTTEAEQLTVGVDRETPGVQSPLPFWKRGLDLLCLTAALPLTLPVGLCIAAYIKLTSPGPVIFQQERIGLQGRRFTCFKFRSMRVNAEVTTHRHHLRDLMQADVPLTKLDSRGDARLIPLGALLRATGLDELPQLLNVLLGDMSLVGPRPCLPYEYEDFSDWDKQRCNAVPGLTGLWQVSGKNKTTFRQMIQLDIQYARSKSFWLDVRIMFRTFSALMTQVRETLEANTMPWLVGSRDAAR